MLPLLVADMDIAAPVVHFLRDQGVDIVSAREEGWGGLTDSQILARAHAMGRFVLTHDSDFGTLAVHRSESFTGILYLRPGGRPPSEVIVDVQALMEAEIDWMPPSHCRVPQGPSAATEALRRDMITVMHRRTLVGRMCDVCDTGS